MKNLWIVSFCFTFHLFSQIIEINQIQEIIPHITHEKTLVVFDIDNTLLHPVTDLGSDQWFTHLVQEKIALGHDMACAIAQTLPLYFHVNFKVNLVCTEPALHVHVETIKTLSQHTICLTMRSAELIEKTVEELKKNRLFFNPPLIEEAEINALCSFAYKEGIIFCGSYDKGTALMKFLDLIDYYPGLIIFIDDKEKYLHSVKNAASLKGIQVIGFRYAGCDHRVGAFQNEATKQELVAFLEQHPLKLVN